MSVKKGSSKALAFDRDEVIADYRLAYQSRQVSLIGRREVLSGNAKFGIFGGGKEVAQLAMAKVFQKGDFRSGYYRDQTLMFALGEHSIAEFFAQLYADPDLAREPAMGGRSMNAHFATRSLNPDGSWRNLMEIHNSSADVSPTASQMPRLVGLAYASRLYRELEELNALREFSNQGREIAFGTIGNASCAEGMFWESLNAITVLESPAVISIWDDDYGISVSNEHQVSKDLSELLSGFQRNGSGRGYDLYRARAWDYPELIDVYKKAAETARQAHVPAIIHVVEATQPQGHSTSGSHERYKSEERLNWEKEKDCLRNFRQWIVDREFATEKELEDYEGEDRRIVEGIREQAWKDFKAPIYGEIEALSGMLDEIAPYSKNAGELSAIKNRLTGQPNPVRKDVMAAVHQILVTMRMEDIPAKQVLVQWKNARNEANEKRYSSSLYSDSVQQTTLVPEVKASYSQSSPLVNGFEILNRAFDSILERDPRVVAFGEDLGKIGGVNQAFAGLQKKYGELRVSDTGIREMTIVGQAIGLAMRGLRPIAEIQYLDYLLYALQLISDDLATLRWRTVGGQKAPVIVRTRGHRLEGVWHSGSYMAGIIHLVRGMQVLVPRNMVQAAGFYNTLLLSDEPGLIVEALNGYRLKERLPDNIGEFTVPVGVPEVLREGSDVTIVTYGPLCRISLEAAQRLEAVGIDVEIIDVQSLLPFDIHGAIVESLKKTNRILFLDEDVPGGTTAYMLQEVLEKQGGYTWLDAEPRTLSAKAHRPAYGSDGNYWSKPNRETIFDVVYGLMHEAQPAKFPLLDK